MDSGRLKPGVAGKLIKPRLALVCVDVDTGHAQPCVVAAPNVYVTSESIHVMVNPVTTHLAAQSPKFELEGCTAVGAGLMTTLPEPEKVVPDVPPPDAGQLLAKMACGGKVADK